MLTNNMATLSSHKLSPTTKTAEPARTSSSPSLRSEPQPEPTTSTTTSTPVSTPVTPVTPVKPIKPVTPTPTPAPAPKKVKVAQAAYFVSVDGCLHPLS